MKSADPAASAAAVALMDWALVAGCIGNHSAGDRAGRTAACNISMHESESLGELESDLEAGRISRSAYSRLQDEIIRRLVFC